jgi:hypothetical protein
MFELGNDMPWRKGVEDRKKEAPRWLVGDSDDRVEKVFHYHIDRQLS